MNRTVVALLLSAFLLGPVGLHADEATRVAQERLWDENLYFGAVDGRSGPETESAIRRYQIREGLPVTGRLDARTRAKLGNDGATEAAEFETWAQPVVGAESDPDDFEAIAVAEFVAGSPLDSAPLWKQQAGVRAVQRRLVQQGYKCGAIDGDPGPQTRAAISDFQTANRLANTGLLDEPTYAAVGISEADLDRAPSSSNQRKTSSQRGSSDPPKIGKKIKRSFKKALWHLGL